MGETWPRGGTGEECGGLKGWTERGRGAAVVCEHEGSARPAAGDSGSHRQWLADALKENDPSNVILFLVGSKKDLSVSVSPFPWANCALAVPVTHPCSARLAVTSTVQPDGEGRSQGGPGDAGGVLGCLLPHR